MNIALTDEQRQIVRDVLAAHLPPGFSVRVFGSRAKGRTKPFSDLDLAFKGPERLSLSQIADLRDAFSESDLPFKVDVLDWNDVSPEFQAIVDRDGAELV